MPRERGETTGARIQDWPAAARPRERLLRLGAHALSDAELVALILRDGRPGRTAVMLGHQVLALAGSEGVARLGRMAPAELAQVDGIGPAKAAALLAAVELGRRAASRAAGLPRRLRGPEDAADVLMGSLGHLEREEFVVLLLDTKHGVLTQETVGVGGLDQVPADPREVFRQAVRQGAAAVILAHNHPSGDPGPSRQDLELTERLILAGRLLGIPVLDHLIIGRGRYVSLAAERLVTFEGERPGAAPT